MLLCRTSTQFSIFKMWFFIFPSPVPTVWLQFGSSTGFLFGNTLRLCQSVVRQLICDFLFRHFASYFDRSLRSSFVWGVGHLPDYFSNERQRDVRYVHLVCGSSCDTRHPHNVLMYYKPKPSGTLPLRGVIIRAVHTCVTYLLSQLRKYEIIVPNYEYFGIKKGALGL